jgi:trehalose-phosphatase
MNIPAHKDAQALLEWIEECGISNMIWTTDLDHTVLDMQKDAANVTAAAGLEETFYHLDRLTNGRFFVITGREMDYVDRIFSKRPLKASTEYHNVMRWHEDQAPQELRAQPHWALIDQKLATIIQKYWPADYEMRHKPFMRSIHYSHAPALADPHIKADVMYKLETILIEYENSTGQELVNIDGGAVFDIAPKGSSKGPAMQDILDEIKRRHPQQKLYPIYFGDSPGDLDAVPVLKKAGGKFVSVGADPRVTSLADFQLECTESARDIFTIASQMPPTMRFNPPTPKGPV